MNKYNNTYRFLPYIPEPKRVNKWIEELAALVNSYNQDNISRTHAYQNYFLLHPDIMWSFLASMVSRNAGWNMTDLKGDTFPRLLRSETCDLLFMTFERANWSIFQDAFPQLLLYHYSTIYGKKMFHLCREFQISRFMEKEWDRYWEEKDEIRLVHSLIINEQHLIQQPVIDHNVYKRRVFRTSLFFIEDHLHFSSVLFPTLQGELLGASVHGFRGIDNRIQLGNRLFTLLFHPDYHDLFVRFAMEVEHTGSRKDYEKFCIGMKETNTPELRQVYENVSHNWKDHRDWSKEVIVRRSWYEQPDLLQDIDLTKWFFTKQRQLEKVANIKEAVKRIWFKDKKNRPTL
ncbi:DUF2515 domain-containing protein [Bacillus sp. BHET2]|uniref:DUF2515 family protein n=1 Tax=Bacillus sp. BHET2 TaxID=2583818 RepID=UPI00110EB7B0|nr:DUF2515 family protein [Bacillus sp. BHET2]TMU86794.1 DUF2515 domain-containing protein [Bacillus sp. BHET2]